MKNRFHILIIFMLISTTIWSQSVIKGVVKDTQGDVLPGVNVIIEGSSIGTSTDFDGNYNIQVNKGATLVFSFLGYKTHKLIVGDNVEINVTLAEDTEALSEVVVIGYGSVKREEVTSSIVTVKGDDLTKTVASNVSESLQGKAAGVQVISSGGGPGASPQILIRGITSNLGSDPLLVVDGIMLPSGTSLNFLNPSDIETMQILKDASATAIYGSRASNGALLITTKRGKEGKTAINIDVTRGYQYLEKIKMAGSQEYIDVMNARRLNDGMPATFNIADFTGNTDWWDETIVDYAPVTNLNIGATGGNEKIRYASSFSYLDQESNYAKGWYKRVTGRFNVDFKISDKITLRQDLSPRIETWENTPNQLWTILGRDPLTEVYIPESEREGRNQFSVFTHGNNDFGNPVAEVYRQFDESNFFGFSSNTQLSYEIIPDLTISSQLGFNLGTVSRTVFNPEYQQTVFFLRNINNISNRVDKSLGYVLNNTVSFKKQIDKHTLNFLGGVLYDYNQYNYISGYREGIPNNDNPNLRFLDAATGEAVSTSGSEVTETIYSVIGRIMYNYNNKYYVSSAFRRDASSKFSEENRAGIFPSISAAWDIDSEEFFKMKSVNNLRLQIGYGEVGNQNIDRNAQFFAIGSQNYVFGGERVVTNFLSQFGNPNLKWETVKDFNLGLSGALFDNKLDFTVERYKRTSTDLLFNVKLPNYTGVETLVAQNVGSFESNGWDFQLGYKKVYKEFQMSFNATISTNKSEAKALAPGNEQLFGQRREDLGNRFLKLTQVGEVVGAFYGLKTDGIFQDQFDINSHSSENGVLLQANAKPGDIRFVDYNNDGLINDDDLTIIGNPFPDFYGGLNMDFSYKKFDLSMQWYGTFGNDVLNYRRTVDYSGNGDANVRQGTLNKVWSPQNTSAEFPRLSVNDLNGNYKVPSDLFIEDGSYLRLRNIQLGYNMGIKGFQKSRIYVSGQNVFTFTKYSGFDPEVQAGGNVINDFGVDYARYPISSTFLLGLNLTL